MTKPSDTFLLYLLYASYDLAHWNEWLKYINKTLDIPVENCNLNMKLFEKYKKVVIEKHYLDDECVIIEEKAPMTLHSLSDLLSGRKVENISYAIRTHDEGEDTIRVIFDAW